MGRVSSCETASLRIDVHVGAQSPRALPDDVLDGLTKPFKELPPKHLYDARGAELFDRICELPEYYPTRTERAILDRYADAIVRRSGMAELVELGSGTAAKTRVLLDAMQRAGTLWRYVPFDVAEQTVRDCAAALAGEYPGLSIHGIVGDFERHLRAVPPPRRGHPRVVAFLGGTIGNFAPGARRRFLRALSSLLSAGDYLLLGTDLVKDVDVLEAAYDDAAGVTAEFNRNLLHVLNRELDADFPTELFEHVAFFDPDHEWIEMRLRARRACHVRIGSLDLEVDFARGEELRTEISAKFTRARVEADYAACGLELAEWFTDDDGLFALSLAAPSS
jgi:L-histidine N-alpha-methyltransferase